MNSNWLGTRYPGFAFSNFQLGVILHKTKKTIPTVLLTLFYCVIFCAISNVTSGADRTVKSYSADLVGPMVGLIESTEAHILIRAGNKEQDFVLRLFDANGKEQMAMTTQSKRGQDFVAKFHLTGLKPATEYRYSISIKGMDTLVKAGKDHSFRTLPDSRKNRFTASFVSCANATAEPVWREIQSLEVDLLCLNGDTPYIDTTNLDLANKKHRQFLQLPELAQLVAKTSTLGNWDDHDFGLNNGNGRSFAEHKAKTLNAFNNYRVNGSGGNANGEGVYHKSDHGVIEIFHLDPRYFSQTEPSPIDENQVTCFGTDQWNWLLKSLRKSEAVFKVLAIGGIWQDKKNSETDDMFTYWYERDALFDFIKKEQISGVVLLGGDIHLSRHLIHPQRVGYDLHDFIVSPAHVNTIRSLDVFQPSLEWTSVEPNQFLTLIADATTETPRLTAQFRQPDGQINRVVELTLDDLTPISCKGLTRDLRGSWSFDGDLRNRSILGERVDAQIKNGAVVSTNKGVRGGAAHFARRMKQYLNIPRSILNDNSAAHSISLWFKPDTLPTHESAERHFLLESTAEGKPHGQAAYHISLGIRSAEEASKVKLQLYTHTLKPAAKPGAAPTAISQGGFAADVDRELLSTWTHVVSTFDSKSLKLYLNGNLILQVKLPTPGPASEQGGLIIGGHREGIGRNFDGAIDEIAIWGRVLGAQEIDSLFRIQQAPVEIGN